MLKFCRFLKINFFGFYFFIAAFVLVVVFLDHSNLWFFGGNRFGGSQFSGDRFSSGRIADRNYLSSFADQEMQFRAVVSNEPEDREWNTRFVIKIIANDVLAGTKVLVTTERHRNIAYGDVVEITGTLELPENFFGENGREFDYVGFLEAKGIAFRMRNPYLKTIGHNPPSRIVEALLKLKHFFAANLDHALSEPQSSLAAGILIDGKQSIDATLQEEFRKSGIVHIVVLSGTNVTIVAETIFKTFSAFLPRLVGISAASAGIILFALMTGGAAPVVRASVMALVALLCRSFFRQYNAGRALCLTAAVMVALNPKIFLHDPSFELSFLATFSVIFLVPIFENFFKFLPKKFGLRDTIAATTITQLFLLPMLVYMTGSVSLVSLPVNFVILPIIPLAMLLSFITGISGVVFGGLSAIFRGAEFFTMPPAFAAHIVLSYILGVAHWASSLSLSEVVVGNPPTVLVAVFYAGVLFWAFKRNISASKSLQNFSL